MDDTPITITDHTKESRVYQARGKENVSRGCYICGATESARPYAFGKALVRTSDYKVTVDSHLQSTKRYNHAAPIERLVCDDCIRYQRGLTRARMRKYLILYGAIFLILGVFFTYIFFSSEYDPSLLLGGNSVGSLLFVVVPLVLSAIFFLVAFVGLRQREKPFTQDDGDEALIYLYTGGSQKDSNDGVEHVYYYTRADAGKYPGSPLKR